MDDFEKLINASDLIEWIVETYPDWCVGDVRSIVDHVMDLPSAQPEPCEDAVDRKAIVERVSSWLNHAGYSEGEINVMRCVIQSVQDMPSAQTEIIRCKDCRYYEWMSNRVPEEQTWICHNWNAETGKDDFCSYAERREE